MKTRLIINADDFGKTRTINKAICHGFKNGILTHTTVMVNMPYWREGVSLAKESGFFDRIGLHLNLDEGYPMTDNIRNIPFFCDTNGAFNGNFAKSLTHRVLPMPNSVKKYCEEEIVMQLKTFLDAGLTYRHIDSHHYVHLNNSILSILLPVAKELGFSSMRIAEISSKDGFVKKLYKNAINQRIRKNFDATDFFFSDTELVKHKLCLTGKSIELMVHPDFIKEDYVNVISRKEKKYEPLNLLKSLR